MEQNNTQERKPDRGTHAGDNAAKRAAEAKKTIAEVKNRSENRQKKEQQKKQLIIIGAALLLVIVLVLVIVFAVKGCGGKDDNTVPGTATVPGVTAPAQGDQPTDATVIPGDLSYTAEDYLSSLPFTLYFDPELGRQISEVALSGGEWNAAAGGSVSVNKADVYARGEDADYVYWCSQMAGKSVRLFDASESAYYDAVVDKASLTDSGLALSLRSMSGTEGWTFDEGDMLCAPEATPVESTELLPIVSSASTEEKYIVITLDDLGNVDNLNKIMTIAESNGARLTLFAEGSQVAAKNELQEALRRADKLYFEIENYTYNHDKALYSLSDSDMAYQISMTQKAVNSALGVDYEMHFLRTPGGNGEYDARTHQYLSQLGSYKGIAHWSEYGSNEKLANIKKNLKAGKIYRFHCSNADLAKLEDFIPYAVLEGYQIVTLNELLGYDANVKSALTDKENTVPAPAPYVYSDAVLLGGKNYSQLYAVQILQRRLIDLGYLSKTAKVDGDYGETTTIAVKLFQRYNGLDTDGKAGKGTQAILFSSEAIRNPSTYIAGEPSTYPKGEELEIFKSSAS